MASPANIIMIVEPDERLAHEIADLVKKAVEGCQVIFAKDGYEASVRLKNTVPNVLITDHDLHKHYPGKKLVESVFRDKRLNAIGVIVLSSAGAESFCPDQAATGQIQFVNRPIQNEVFERALLRALFRSRSDAGEFRIRVLDPGQILFSEGEAAAHAYLLKSGKLRAFRQRGGLTEIFGEILPGEFVGEMAYIDGEPRSASVDAVDKSELIEIPIKNLDAIVFSKPAWSKALLKTLSRRLKGANNKKAA